MIRPAGYLLLSLLVSAGAMRAGALCLSGAVAATILGTLVLGSGGFTWAALLGLFFVSSSALSHLPGGHDSVSAKGKRRDVWQVLANGGVPGLCAVANTHSHPLWFVAYAGALASATADTWATEIGKRYGGRPVNLRTRRFTAPGTSGAVTLIGTVASAAGALLIASAAGLFAWAATIIVPCALGGFVGALADSLIGANWQELRRCPHCDLPTEQMLHVTCGTPTVHYRGWPGLNNDAVNAASTLLGAVTSVLLWKALY